MSYLVPFRDHVRGALHPHAVGNRHPRGAFIFQETLTEFAPPVRRDRRKTRSRPGAVVAINIIVSAVVCALWGYLLYNFEIGPLWLMMGIANQMLAVIGLALGTTYILQYAARADVRPLHRHPLRFRRRDGLYGRRAKRGHVVEPGRGLESPGPASPSTG